MPPSPPGHCNRHIPVSQDMPVPKSCDIKVQTLLHFHLHSWDVLSRCMSISHIRLSSNFQIGCIYIWLHMLTSPRVAFDSLNTMVTNSQLELSSQYMLV